MEPHRFRTFLTVWLGQSVSMLGSGLTGFALGVWVYQRTGSATQYALIALFIVLPGTLLSPVAGALVDRWDRRRAMILSDTGAGLSTLLLAALLWSGRLEVWHIYLLQAVSSASNAFQWPAFAATTTLLVPSRQLGRASGLTQLGFAVSQLASPLLAGALVGRIGVPGVMLIDVATFLFALATLAVVRFPRPEASAEGLAARGSLLREAWGGWLFVRRRRGLVALLALLAMTNFCTAILQVLALPLVLSFASAAVLGRVASVAGLGMVAGSVAMSVWGGPARRIHGIYAFLPVQAAALVLAGLRPNAVLIAVAGFAFLFTFPVIEGCSQAIWQTKVPADLQGRVFAVRRTVAWSMLPLAYLLAGPLADRVLGPLLLPGGLLASSVGTILGVGKGRGIGLLYVLLGTANLAIVAVAWRYAPLRRVEIELPDAVTTVSAAPSGAIPEAAPVLAPGAPAGR